MANSGSPSPQEAPSATNASQLSPPSPPPASASTSSPPPPKPKSANSNSSPSVPLNELPKKWRWPSEKRLSEAVHPYLRHRLPISRAQRGGRSPREKPRQIPRIIQGSG